MSYQKGDENRYDMLCRVCKWFAHKLPKLSQAHSYKRQHDERCRGEVELYHYTLLRPESFHRAKWPDRTSIPRKANP